MTKKLERLERNYARQDYNEENRGLANFTSTPEGRQALWWLLGACGTFTNPFDGNALNTAFASGQQSVGQLILARLGEADPQAFITATGENYDRTIARDSARRIAGRSPDDDNGGYERDPE